MAKCASLARANLVRCRLHIRLTIYKFNIAA